MWWWGTWSQRCSTPTTQITVPWPSPNKAPNPLHAGYSRKGWPGSCATLLLFPKAGIRHALSTTRLSPGPPAGSSGSADGFRGRQPGQGHLPSQLCAWVCLPARGKTKGNSKSFILIYLSTAFVPRLSSKGLKLASSLLPTPDSILTTAL